MSEQPSTDHPGHPDTGAPGADETGLGTVLGTRPVPTVPGDGQVTVGIAVPIPEPFAAQLRAARLASGDPQALVVPPHVTLLPPTQVRSEALPLIREHLLTVGGTFPPFRVTLSGTATFRPVTPVVYVKVVEGGNEYADLEARIRDGVLDRDLTFDYHPHVTIAHHLSDEKLDDAQEKMARFRATFQVTGFGLYSFDADGHWQVDVVVGLGG